MLGRLSTQLMFNLLGDNITFNQGRLFDVSNKVSTQKNFIHAYENPADATKTIQIQTRIAENNQLIRNRSIAKQELEAAEAALRIQEGLLQRLREIVVSSSNGAFGPDERLAFANEVESIKDSVVQAVNTKINGNYVFSGQQSNLVTYRLKEGAAANAGVYKHNQDDTSQRTVDGIPTSFDIKAAIIGEASSASFTNGNINPVASVGGDLDFSVNDGSGNAIDFTATIGAGDDLSDIISAINTAFVTAGGAGAIAQESPEGYLNMDTALITGNTTGNTAKVHVLSSSDSDLVNELYIRKQLNEGKNAGVFHTIETILTALQANDSNTLLGLLDDMDFNLSQMNNLTAEVGLSVARMENLDTIAEDKDIALQINRSAVQDVDMVRAGLEIANAQASLEASTQITSAFFQQSLRQFLS